MDVHVVMPWRPQPSRLYMFGVVNEWIVREFPEWTRHHVDTPGRQFNVSACRNTGVRMAEESGADIVVILDADVVLAPENMAAAVSMVESDGGFVIPYTTYWCLDAQGEQQMQAGIPMEKCHSVHMKGSIAGAWVTTPKDWWDVGGNDERFAGWGWEDTSWHCAATTLSTVTRLDGRLMAGHHDPQARAGLQQRRNMNLYRRYIQAQDNPKKMQVLVGSQDRYQVTGGPLAVIQ